MGFLASVWRAGSDPLGYMIFPQPGLVGGHMCPPSLVKNTHTQW